MVIQTHNLTKIYQFGRKGAFKALDNLNLSVKEGEIFGYLGPNGAGKTTTIRMMLDIIRPTSGRIEILGMDAQRDSVALHHHIGFMPGELNLWKNEKAINIIKYFGRVRGNLDMAYVKELAERLQFDMSKKFREYSSGNKRKLGLILALMHRPQLLILDEPTSGLDPLMQQTFNQLMREIREEGRTVFLSSHVLSEVQAICDRVGILRGGLLRAVENVEDLTHANFRWITIQYDGHIPDLSQVAGVSEVTKVNGTTVKFRFSGDFDPLLRTLTQADYIRHFKTQEPTLEEIFLAFYDDGQNVMNDNTKQEVAI
ncbi:MAG: ABC transporter [Phototrophicales bacterium]|nr:MAG: ABC transporter [Phototrophicales bacterium]RMG72178.1 MAG: ABC transporter ATP-binding protein [Chloroflexota bacterium]